MAARRWIAALSIVSMLAGCTSTTVPDPTPPPPGSPPGTSSPEATPSPGATLASGAALPTGCDGARPRRSQTVAFVAEGRAWALDPRGLDLTCVFEVGDAAPFAWGPQGDRVLLGGMEIHGVGTHPPSFTATGAQPAVWDWGHPLGLSVVFAEGDRRVPQKRFMDDGHVERLPMMPAGAYLDIAYHPSGHALAVAIQQHGEQSIWISTNEGTDPAPLVHSEGGTRFPSIAFSPDGERLLWIAQHLNTYQVHEMDLRDRTGFDDGWRGELDEEATNLHLAPEGDLMALDVGITCDERKAVAVLSPTVARPALPDETRPTTVVGWLDRTTLLVSAGGCDEAIDLFAVDVLDGSVTDLVRGAELGATRTAVTDAPESVPVPPEQAPPPPPEGVG